MFFFQLYIFKYNFPRQFKTKQTKKTKISDGQIWPSGGLCTDIRAMAPPSADHFVSHTLPYLIV